MRQRCATVPDRASTRSRAASAVPRRHPALRIDNNGPLVHFAAAQPQLQFRAVSHTL